jgi:hypothetical protein
MPYEKQLADTQAADATAVARLERHCPELEQQLAASKAANAAAVVRLEWQQTELEKLQTKDT